MTSIRVQPVCLALAAIAIAVCAALSDRVHAQAPSATPTPPAVEFVPHQLIVRLTGNESAKLTALLARIDAIGVKKFETVEGLYVLTLPETMDVWSAGALAQELEAVTYAEPNYIVNTQQTIPNDPRFADLWGLRNTGQSGGTVGADIQAANAWNITTGSSNVVVAVLDTGTDYTHPDLAANMFRNEADCNANGVDDDGNGYVDDCYGIDTANHDSDPFDDHSHGTHTSGTIGAAGNNAIGVAGVNWNVRLMACKFLSGSGSGSTADAVSCLDYVARMKDLGANIVATSNSWGGGGYSQALYDAIEAQRQRGILFIAAAGNSNSNNDTVAAYPADYDLPNVIAVAATTRTDTRSSFSSYGRRTVHIGAPGSEIWSTTPGNSYQSFSGTSMATPHVAGVAALLKAQDPARDWRAIRNLILAGGDDNASLNSITMTGKRLNAFGSLTCANRTVFSPLKPVQDSVSTSVGAPVTVSALSINCGVGNGNVAVTATGGSVVTLVDDGAAPDQVAGDGIYSGVFVPASVGTFVLTFPNGAAVTVQANPSPAVTTQPQSQTIASGLTAALSVVATGTPPLGYQWYAGTSGTTSNPLAGATASSFITPALTTATNYWVRVSNAFGAANSTTATITIATASAITTHPQSHTIISGQTATLSVTATGTAPRTYQWYAGGSGTTTDPIAGATASTFTTPALSAIASYWVRVSNPYGPSADSNTATISLGATLTGTVRNATTNAAVAGATVSISPGGFSATTNASGVYTKVVPANTYTLTVSATDYVPGTASGVVVTLGLTTNRDIALAPVVYAPAVYDATLKAPKCAAIGAACDSTTLLVGRGAMSGGAEPNQPNTILNACADGTAGSFHSDESIDRITLASVSGGSLGSGQAARINVTVWAYSASNRLDLYYTGDASHPIWTYLTTLTPSGSGLQVLSTTYVLPTGGLQAVRANFRWLQAPSVCTTGSSAIYDDHDDLIFAAGTGPAITTQPQSQTIAPGQTATLSVVATGAPLSYQWYLGASGATTTPIAGAVADIFTTPALTSTTTYWVRVSNAYGQTDSSTSTITMGVPPAITTQPLGRTVADGDSATMNVSATGSTPRTYQWYVGASGTTTSPIAGATSSSFTTPPLAATTSYWLRVSNLYGTADSTSATITVAPRPTIATASPWPAATAGTAYNLLLQATGGAAPYTWTLVSGTLLPSGLTLDGSSGAISGVPNAAGPFVFGIRASGADALFSEKTFGVTVAPAADPLANDQWHLSDRLVEIAGANVRPVWPTARGAGVVIGIVDDGLQWRHPDLQANYVASLSYDFNGGDNDPSPVTSGSCATTANCRGTAVAGIAAARGENGIGGSGVAPLASLAGVRLTGATATDANEAAAFTHELQAIHIENNSWGPPDDGQTLARPGPLARAARKTAAAVGRGGKGRIFVWAAGDGRANADNCNFSGYANSRFAIAVGAVDDAGLQATSSESCSALLVSAPSKGTAGLTRGVPTTDLIGAAGYDPSDYASAFGGTGAAAPVVSGVVALMLARNPALTWRDVQHILVRSSRQVDASDPSWTAGALPHSEKYGFGVVDAVAAVNLAASWTNVRAEAAVPSATHDVSLAIPDNSATGVSHSIAVGAQYAGYAVEHVDVEFSATHARRGDLEVTLTSPAGIVSHLATVRPGDTGADFSAWRFRSVRHWSESPAGQWTLKVADRAAGTTGTFTSWRLRIYGTAPAPPAPAPPAPPPPPPPGGGGGGGGGGNSGGGGGGSDEPAPLPPPAPAPPAPIPVAPPAPAPSGPGAPVGLAGTVFGKTVVLSWNRSASGSPPASYILEAGSAAGASNVIVYALGSAATSYTAPGVGPGTYFVRVRAVNAFGTSAPSNEIAFTIGNGSAPIPAGGIPGPPIGLAASTSGSSLTLSWNPPAFGGAAAFYIVEAGSAVGLKDLANFSTGNASPSFSASGVPPGTYYVRVRAGNALGTSAPSNEAVFLIAVGGAPGPGAAPAPGPAPGPAAGPCSAPSAPGNLQFSVTGSTVALAWTAASGASSYIIEAGSSPGAADLVVSDTGNAATTLTANGVGAGTYFVRMRGRNSCGAGAASNDVTIQVR
jgi:subtilisin family serine protease